MRRRIAVLSGPPIGAGPQSPVLDAHVATSSWETDDPTTIRRRRRRLFPPDLPFWSSLLSTRVTATMTGRHDGLMARPTTTIRLDADKIVTAALAVAERHGLSGTTLRMVGAELGADPTAIYRHFESKEALVTAMANRLFGEIARREIPGDWRQRLAGLLRASRALYRTNPTLVDVLANQPEESDSVLALNEMIVECLAEAGLDHAQIGMFHQVMGSYVIGSALLDAAWDHPDGGTREASRGAYSAL